MSGHPQLIRNTHRFLAWPLRARMAVLLIVASLHIMGTARMGGDPGTSATNPDGEVWGTSNVVVADASCFPTAPGVNPMVSIEAIARMNALRLAARLT